jgi:hypothetical protein
MNEEKLPYEEICTNVDCWRGRHPRPTSDGSPNRPCPEKECGGTLTIRNRPGDGD